MLSRFKNRDLKAIVTNFISLVVLNIVNYVFPIILIPILITRLGLDVYGKYIFVFTILGYLNLIVQYGFNFSATSKIAKHRDNIEVISETYTSITLIRLFFSIIITVFIVMYMVLFNDEELYLLGIGIFLGQGLIPVWLFQGLEKMKLITIINFIIRLSAFVLIFFLVNNEKDVWILMSIQSLSFLLGAIVSILIVYRQLGIKFVKLDFKNVNEELREGFSLFLSTVGINLYRESNIVILGIVCGYSVVALYSPAEKLIKGFQSFSNIIVTSIYPFFSRKINDNKQLGLIVFKRFGKKLTLFFAITTVVIFINSSFIIEVYLGYIEPIVVLNLKVLSLVLLLGGLNYYYGIVGLVNLGQGKVFNNVVWCSGILGMLSSVLLSYLYAGLGAAISLVFSELLLLVLVILKLKKYENDLFDNS